MKGFTTKAIHAGSAGRDLHGSLRVPVYDSVAFEQESSRDIQLAFEGKKPAHTYSRITNPTTEDLEQKILQLSGGRAALAVASGMAAISNTILTLAGAGANIVTSPHIFGNTLSLFEKTLQPWGLEVRLVDMSDPAQVANAIDSKTSAVFLESITNPQLEVVDCKAISRITREKRIPLVLDNTVTTPYLFNSKNVGVDIEILSSTKYISGGATSVGGIIIDTGNFDWTCSAKLNSWTKTAGQFAFLAAMRREIYRNVGACMSPHNAYLQSLGLETMALRIDKSCQNALELARFLDNKTEVKSVDYPGLESSACYSIARQQFNNKFGGLLTFDLESKESCFAFMDAMRIIRRATNVNDNKTLILHPSSTIFSEFSVTRKIELGVRPTMLRLSVGIEDIEDLQDDLEKGLRTV
nr:O-acetylhomoserine aminocarboxypropyltransferase/cysteine synthase [Desulfobulbaceae bacterium]